MRVAVVGASGHTGRFVIEEIARRGLQPVAVARDRQRLLERGIDPKRVETRIASLDDCDALDRALEGVDAVVNCAGPFLDTAQSVVEAALRRRAHYFDVTAEQRSAQHTFDAYGDAARDCGITIVPAAGFYGALGDLLATAALGDWLGAAEIRTAVALDRWWPTLGTRRTGARNTFTRLRVRNAELEPIDTPASTIWNFPEPFGAHAVVELPLSETILMARHLRVREIRHFINEAPLNDLHDEATPQPVAADERGRSQQVFMMDTVVSNGSDSRRLVARGRDIYATTAPIVLEAVERVLRGDLQRFGAFTPAELFEPASFLKALAPHDLTISEN